MVTFLIDAVYPNGHRIQTPPAAVPRVEAEAWGEQVFRTAIAEREAPGRLRPVRLELRHNPSLSADALAYLLADEAACGPLDLAGARGLLEQFAQVVAAHPADRGRAEALQELLVFSPESLAAFLVDIGLARRVGEGCEWVSGPALAQSLVDAGHEALLVLPQYQLGRHHVVASGLTIGPDHCQDLAISGTRLQGAFYFDPVTVPVPDDSVLARLPDGRAQVALSLDWRDVMRIGVFLRPVRVWDIAAAGTPSGPARVRRPAGGLAGRTGVKHEDPGRSG